MRDTRPCTCGSGRPSTWKCDARGIPLTRTCGECHEKRMSRFRPEVLTDPNYAAEEPIEEDQ